MFANPLHLALRTARLAALAVCAAALAGCAGVTGLQPVSQVRVIDASPDAPALDIYQSSTSQSEQQPGLYNIGFGTVSSYIPIASGAYAQTASIAGTRQQLAQVRGTFSPGNQYTILTGNIAADLQMAVLKDQSTPAPSGEVAFRFLGQATRAGAVDIYLQPSGVSLAGIAPIAAAVPFGGNTGYIDAPDGTYSILAYPAGANPAVAVPEYTGIQTAYPSTAVRTVILLDRPQPSQSSDQTIPALQIVTANDYDPAAS